MVDNKTIIIKKEHSIIGLTYSVIHSLIALYAVYLSFKCNQGLNLGGLILALIFPWFYVLYHQAVSNGCVNP